MLLFKIISGVFFLGGVAYLTMAIREEENREHNITRSLVLATAAIILLK